MMRRSLELPQLSLQWKQLTKKKLNFCYFILLTSYYSFLLNKLVMLVKGRWEEMAVKRGTVVLLLRIKE